MNKTRKNPAMFISLLTSCFISILSKGTRVSRWFKSTSRIYIICLYLYIYIYIRKITLVCSLLIKTLVCQIGQYCYHAAVNYSSGLLIKIWGWYKLCGVKKFNHYGKRTRSDTIIFRLNYAGKSLPNVSSQDLISLEKL